MRDLINLFPFVGTDMCDLDNMFLFCGLLEFEKFTAVRYLEMRYLIYLFSNGSSMSRFDSSCSSVSVRRNRNV